MADIPWPDFLRECKTRNGYMTDRERRDRGLDRNPPGEANRITAICSEEYRAYKAEMKSQHQQQRSQSREAAKAAKRLAEAQARADRIIAAAKQPRPPRVRAPPTRSPLAQCRDFDAADSCSQHTHCEWVSKPHCAKRARPTPVPRPRKRVPRSPKPLSPVSVSPVSLSAVSSPRQFSQNGGYYW